ncbi:hypothetical protein I4U23_000253 [Adineta vaga]|nr:hypothetical protein I4U23_000253 [Adineta vaga]
MVDYYCWSLFGYFWCFCFILIIQIAVTGSVWPYLFTSRFICILRNYISIFSTQASLYSKCLITFDIWATTSQHVSISQWSSVKRARLLILINLIVWALLSIPYGIWNNIMLVGNVWQCFIVGEILINYHGYFFLPCLVLFTPILLLCFFGYQSYVHVTRLHIHRRTMRLQKQFIRMILTQALVIIISFLPYTAQFAYSTITARWQKDSQWMALDSIIVQTGRMCFFFGNAVDFYIYMNRSNEIRSIFRQILFNLGSLLRQNQVAPIDHVLHMFNT